MSAGIQEEEEEEEEVRGQNWINTNSPGAMETTSYTL